MRFLRLLLLLLLPGLVLPAGMLLRICLCEPAVGSAVSGCCAPSTPEPAERACCSRGAGESSERLPDEPGSSARPAHACRCLWLQLGEEQPDPERPRTENAPSFALLPGPEGPAPALPAELRVGRAVRERIVRPPPDHQRTLPLLL
jgi:hypothetical protein